MCHTAVSVSKTSSVTIYNSVWQNESGENYSKLFILQDNRLKDWLNQNGFRIVEIRLEKESKHTINFDTPEYLH